MLIAICASVCVRVSVCLALVPLGRDEKIRGVVGRLGLVIRIHVVTQQACHGDPQRGQNHGY